MELDRRIEESKLQFVERAEKGGNNSREYFSMIKTLGTKDKPSDWDVTDLFPGRTPAEAGEEISSYFTQISDEFPPLNRPA